MILVRTFGTIFGTKKKNIECILFGKKKHPYTCVCAVFVVSLCPNFKINNPANGSQYERSPGKEKARK